jgi:amidohydrolase
MTLRFRSPSLVAAALVAGTTLSLSASSAAAQGKGADPLAAEIETRMAAVMPKVVAWRRDIHEHPELSNQETRTAALVEWTRSP